jgi:hypothetical protein
LQRELADQSSLRARVFKQYRQLLLAKSASAAFHPHGTQQVLDLHPAVFAVERISPDGKARVLCLHNISAEKVNFTTDYSSGINLFTNQSSRISNIMLEPHQILWVKL